MLRRASRGMGRRGWLPGSALGLATLLLLGAAPPDKTPKPSKEKPVKAEETVGDVAFVRREANIQVEGVGLVIGLNNTGSNPEPSAWRTELLDRMKKAGVPNSESWLESPTTSLVIVNGRIPVGVTPDDPFDIDVSLSPASTTTSLEGGHLLLCELKVVQVVDGNRLDGQVMAEAYGPLITGTLDKPDDLKRGRILGGARVKRELPYQLVLKPERVGYRAVSLLQGAINNRFFTRKGIEQTGMAEAKRPDLIVLNVPKVYHHNQFRYFQVVERMPLVDTPALRAQRQEKWARELLDPKTAGMAALSLEGIGKNTIPTLKQGLTSPNAQVRFFSAEALAYLNDSAGADELASAAVKMPEFQAFALAALAAMDHPASILRLSELMAQAEPRVRYGAFRALRTLDPYHPNLGRVRLMQDEAPEPGADDTMALRLRSTPRQKTTRREDPFELYLVDCEGPPLVHVAKTRRREIVVFGRQQKLMPPVVLGGTGPILLNASATDDAIQISRIGADETRGDARALVDPHLGAVIVQVANLGATYPEILKILESAHRQKNLEGELLVDAVPDPQRIYDEAQVAGVDATAKKDSAVGRAGLESGKTASDSKTDPAPSDEKKAGLFSRFRERLRRR